MTTTNPRVNVTLEPNTITILNSLAKHEHKSVSSLIKELISEALDRREDRFLSAVAAKRDIVGAKTVDHDDAWK